MICIYKKYSVCFCNCVLLFAIVKIYNIHNLICIYRCMYKYIQTQVGQTQFIWCPLGSPIRLGILGLQIVTSRRAFIISNCVLNTTDMS